MRHRLAVLASTFLALAAPLAGCVSSKTFVLHPVEQGVTYGRVALKPSDASVKVDAMSQSDFEKKLAERLRREVGAEVGTPPDLILQYRFVLFDQGSGGARVASGITNVIGSPVYGIGDGAVGVEVTYLKPDGMKVGQIVTDGPIAGAFGSTSGALDAAALSVARYTKMNFTCPTCGAVGPVNPEPQKVEGLKTMASASR